MAFLDILKQKVYRPVVLLILDGWGIAPSWGGNAKPQLKTLIIFGAPSRTLPFVLQENA